MNSFSSVYIPTGKFKYINLFVLLTVLVYIFIEAKRQGDFWVFIEASKLLIKRGDIYTSYYGKGLHYYYSTLFSLILVPLTYLPFYMIKVLWLLLNLFFTLRIWILIRNYLDTSSFSTKQYFLLTFLSFGFAIRFLFANFHMLQLTVFMLYATLEGLNFLNKRKTIAGSLLIALAINIKILPLVLIPYLIYRNKLKAAACIIIFTVAFCFLPALFIGFNYNLFLLEKWWALINPTNPIHTIDISESGFHNLAAWLPTLLMKNSANHYTLPYKRNIMDLSYNQVAAIILFVRMALAAFVVYFLRTLPFKPAATKLNELWEISYILLITPLIFPHQQVYAFFYIFPAVVYCMYLLLRHTTGLTKGKYYMCVGLLILSFLLLCIGGLLGFLDAIAQHYKLITYGTLVLIIPLAILKPVYASKPNGLN